MCILLVSGSRSIKDKDFVFNRLDQTKKDFDFDTIIEGGAKGVDSLAREYAIANGLNLITKYPDWTIHGRIAALLRNTEMVKICDKGVAIWDGKSRGTKDTISKLKRAGKLLKVFLTE